MDTLKPIDPKERIEILDVLRGFALLGIIFNNMLFFSGYSFVPFDDLKQIMDFQLNEKIYYIFDVIISGKFYALFSILFATGFFLQFSKYFKDSTYFLKIYRRRIFILLILGVIHSLIWFGDILLTYSITALILILFRKVKSRNLLRWSLFFLLLPIILDLFILPFFPTPNIILQENTSAVAHVNYPDMAPKKVIDTFQNGDIKDLVTLNIHNIVWKYLGYIPSGGFQKILGIFLLGYYLASIGFFTKPRKINLILILSFMIGLIATISSRILGGSVYLFPPTLPNTLYKFLLTVGQIFMSIFYITSIIKISQLSLCKKILKYLIPVGRMALTNYLTQTMIMIVIFYNFGFNLIGKSNLIHTTIIVVLILIFQIIFSKIWLTHYRFGPFEWIWRCLTYKIILKIRYDIN